MKLIFKNIKFWPENRPLLYIIFDGVYKNGGFFKGPEYEEFTKRL